MLLPRLASTNSPDSPLEGKQACSTMPSSCGAGAQTEGSVNDREELYQLIPIPAQSDKLYQIILSEHYQGIWKWAQSLVPDRRVCM